MVYKKTPVPQLIDAGDYKETVDDEPILVTKLYVDDTSTSIDKDESNNLTLTDAVTGTKTLAELSASGSGTVDTSGTPVANDYARFTDADTIEGRSYSEVKADLSLEDADINTLITATKLDDLTAPDDTTDLDATAAKHGLMSKAYASKLDGIEASADVTDTTNVTSAGALMDSELTDITAVKALADGAISDVDTGTSTTMFVTPDALQGSFRNLRFIDFVLVEGETDVAVDATIYVWRSPFGGTIIQDDSNKNYFCAWNETAGTTGTMVVDIHLNGTTIMTTNKLDIETGETSTATAATQPDLTTTSFSAGDLFLFAVDAIHTTAAKGLTVRLCLRPS